jgi:hypothetical protein
VVDEAEVFVVRFALIEQRLLVDTRPDSEGRPYIHLVPPVNSAEERYRFLRKERPDVPLPAQITVFQWPGPITVLRDLGVWQFIEDRVGGIGGEPALEDARRAFLDGQRLERADILAAIHGGEGYQTLWERPR